MTTPAPAELLDQLTALHAAATPGEWHVTRSGGIAAGKWYTVSPVAVADAALIVAAVKHLPALIAAVRAVLALTYASDDGSEREHQQAEGCDGQAECGACWALDIRRTITDALTPKETP